MSSNNSCGATPISTGAVWVIGWIFTVGFAHLAFGKGVLAILLWPYYLGVALR